MSVRSEDEELEDLTRMRHQARLLREVQRRERDELNEWRRVVTAAKSSAPLGTAARSSNFNDEPSTQAALDAEPPSPPPSPPPSAPPPNVPPNAPPEPPQPPPQPPLPISPLPCTQLHAIFSRELSNTCGDFGTEDSCHARAEVPIGGGLPAPCVFESGVCRRGAATACPPPSAPPSSPPPPRVPPDVCIVIHE